MADGQPRAFIVLGVTSRGLSLCPGSWVLRESSARGVRAKILEYRCIYIYVPGFQGWQPPLPRRYGCPGFPAPPSDAMGVQGMQWHAGMSGCDRTFFRDGFYDSQWSMQMRTPARRSIMHKHACNTCACARTQCNSFI